MKKTTIIMIALALGFASCSEQEKKSEAAPEVQVIAEPVKVELPFKATLTDDWTIGDPEKVRVVLQMYKNLVNDTLYEDLRQYLADTVVNIAFDDKVSKLTPDQFIAAAKAMRGQFTKLDEEFKTHVNLHSDKLQTDQVILWVTERATFKSGKQDSTVYQENWRFNKDGKIYERSTYMRY